MVGADFRVEGTDALFLCDASAFPTSVGVNPQLTVMALAQLAAETILGGPAPPSASVSQWAPPAHLTTIVSGGAGERQRRH